MTDFNIKEASSAALVDMGGAADSVAKRNKTLSDDIKTELRSRVGSNLPSAETSTIVGTDFAAVVGKVSEKIDAKSIKNDEVIDMIGQEAFNAISAVSVTVLKAALAEADFNGLVTKTEGTRAVSFKELDT